MNGQAGEIPFPFPDGVDADAFSLIGSSFIGLIAVMGGDGDVLTSMLRTSLRTIAEVSLAVSAEGASGDVDRLTAGARRALALIDPVLDAYRAVAPEEDS